MVAIVLFRTISLKLKAKALIPFIVLFAFASMPVLAQANCGDVVSSDLTLANNVTGCNSGNGLIINTSGITLDCNGYIIHSNTHNYSGVVLEKSVNSVTIRNCKILNFNTGISGNTCSNNSNVVIKDTLLDNNTALFL